MHAPHTYMRPPTLITGMMMLHAIACSIIMLAWASPAGAQCVPAEDASSLRNPDSVAGIDEEDNAAFAMLDMEEYIVSDDAAASDLKTAEQGLAAYYKKHHRYLACDSATTCQRDLGINLTGGVDIRIVTIAGGYVMTTHHEHGLGIFIHNSWQPDETRYCRP